MVNKDYHKPTERHQCTFRSTSRRQFGFLAIA